jgi:hypothetical protein
MPDRPAPDHLGLPPQFFSTRSSLHRIAVHVMGRRRHQVSGRFGLRSSPGGFATPAFGEDVEVIRVDRGMLIRETTEGARQTQIDGASLTELARFAGCDLSKDFSAGDDAPELGDPDGPIESDPDASAVIASWYHVGWQILDQTLGELPESSLPATIQLWPEHFDAGTHVGLSNGQRANLGVSPGDAYNQEPYLYIGPWTDDRPGDPSFWNAPFGAVIGRSELLAVLDPVARGMEFIRSGLALLNG